MAIGITFDKEKAEYFVDRLNRGAAIERVETTEDMMALIGACRYVVSTRAPTGHPGTRRAEPRIERQPAFWAAPARAPRAGTRPHTAARRRLRARLAPSRRE